jgi:hypothetical protein
MTISGSSSVTSAPIGVSVDDRLDEADRLPHGDRLATGAEGELADPDLVATFLGLLLGEAS